MSFLNPIAILIGGVALGVPLAVHFLTRPRPVRMPLSTVAFVFEAIQQRRSRHRLRDLLVLLLRLLAVALIALAIARPNMDRQVVISPGQSDVKVARVVIIDVSRSMSAGRGGNQPLQRARSVADKYLSAGDDSVANVVFAAAKPRPVFEQLSINLPALRQSVRSAEVFDQAANAMAAIGSAAELLTQTDEVMKRELVVISDFQRSDWGAARFDALPSDTTIQLESVALDSRENLAVLAVNAPDRIVSGTEVACEVEVANFGTVDRRIRCRLSLASNVTGQVTKTEEKTLPAGESTISFAMTFDRPGWYSGTVEILGGTDDLPADDMRPVAFRVSPAPRVVFLSGQNAQLRPSSGYYLESAIRRLTGNDKEPLRVAVRNPQMQRLRGADVIIIDHPGRMDRELLSELSGLMRRGIGIIYVVSELADGVNLRGIQDEMGASLQLPVSFVTPARGRPRRDLSLLEVSRREKPFDVFGDVMDMALAPIRVGGGLGTELTEEALRDRVLAILSDRSAFLTLSDSGAGRIAILNADLEQSNLAMTPAFVPLFGELIASVLPTAGSVSKSLCGNPLVRLLPADLDIEDDVIAGPSDDWAEIAEGYGSWEATGTGVIWNWPSPDICGVYEATLEGKVIFKIAISAPASESDLTTLKAGSLDSQGQSEQRIGFRDARDGGDNKDRLWNWLLVACAIGLVLEVCTLRVFQT